MSTFANLHPKYVFGLSAACKAGNVWFVDNNTIMYPAGNAVVLLNLDQKSETFLHGVEKLRGVTCLTVSYNRMYAALGQIGDEDPLITIYDLKTGKQRKALQSPDAKAKEYVSVSFTTDNVHLASLTAAPDYVFVLWKWDRNRVTAMVKATGGQGPVYEVSTSPGDLNVMCAVGNATFRFYRFNESHLKPYGFQKGDAHHFLCHAWYKTDRVIAGTAEGKLMLFERGDYRHDIAIKNVKNEITGGLAEKLRTFAKQKEKEEKEGDGDQTVSESSRSYKKEDPNRPYSIYEGKEVTAIATYSKGFAVAFGVGNVILYEEQMIYSTHEDHYKQMYVVKIPNDTSESEDRIIKALTISPNEELIVASTFNNNIYVFQLSTAEIKEPEEMIFELANCSYHFGAILSLDVAIRKSLIVTCGVDKFIRVWNFLTMSQEAAKEFAEDVYAVSIHPMGLFVLAGMVDKIRLFSILLNDIREVKDWPVRMCKEIKFSNGGHVFAAANGNILQLYSTTSLENTLNMKGHSAKIRKITYTLDDSKVVTAGSDGAIYEWDLQTGKRTADMVERGSNLISVCVTPDTKTHFAVNGHMFIKEIQIQEATILREVDLGAMPTCVCISRSGKILLAGFENGVVRSFRQPLPTSAEWFDYHLHLAAVTSVSCTSDENYCVSVSADNSIVVWKMTDAEGRAAKLEKDLNYSTEVLVTKNDLEERQVALNELKQRYAELKLEMDYALKRKDMGYQEEIRELNIKFADELKDLNNKLDDMARAKDKNTEQYNEYLLEVARKHKEAVENMEAHFNTKLIGEYEKYNALQNLLEETIKEYEKRLVILETDRGKAIEELVDYFESKIKDKNSALEQAFNDARTQMAEGEEMKKQIEEDADQEILEITTSYERKLRHERETNAKLKGEAGIMRKKFQTMQKEIEEHKNEVQRLHLDLSKLTNQIKSTEKEVVQLQKSLVDRETANMQKEKMIVELQKNNSDLEKFKFVLEYRIKELRKIVEPKAREIIYLKQQNADMETELDSTIAIRNGLTLQVTELKNKLKMTDIEYNHEKRTRVRLQVLLDRIRGHMVRCMSVLADHRALKAVVKAMYQKYGEGIQAGKASSAEQEAICELVRQKTHLEISLTSIKRKLSKDAQFTRSEQLKIMNENMLLVYEINSLRRELKVTRDKIASYEIMLGFNQATHMAEAAEMRFKLQHAIEDRDEIDIAHENEIEAKDNVIEAQQEEIDSLSTKILKVHEFVHDTSRPDGMTTTAVDHIKTVLTNNNNYISNQ